MFAGRACMLMQQCVRPTPCFATFLMREYGTSLQPRGDPSLWLVRDQCHAFNEGPASRLYLALRRPALSTQRSLTRETSSSTPELLSSGFALLRPVLRRCTSYIQLWPLCMSAHLVQYKCVHSVQVSAIGKSELRTIVHIA